MFLICQKGLKSKDKGGLEMSQLGFTYLFTNDLSEMKKFYWEILGLNLTWDEEDSIAFMVNDHQLSITYDKNFRKPNPDFAKQPGWKGGTATRTSWSINFPMDEYEEVIERLQMKQTPAYFTAPQWFGYWSYPVLDPMNNTIEMTSAGTE